MRSMNTHWKEDNTKHIQNNNIKRVTTLTSFEDF